MKTQTLLATSLLLVSFSVSAVASAQETSRKLIGSAKCKSCQSADALAKDLSQLDYQRDEDKDKGDLKALNAVSQLESFEKLPAADPQRTQLFSSLVSLSREASPYDGESQLAQILAKLITQDEGLKKTFAADLAAMPKTPGTAASCKTQQLESRVNEASCLKKAKLVGQQPMGEKQEAATKACTDTFNYSKCLKSVKK